MKLNPPRLSAILALLLVGALVAGCAAPDESTTGTDGGAANDTVVDDGTDPGEPSLPAFDPEGDAPTLA